MIEDLFGDSRVLSRATNAEARQIRMAVVFPRYDQDIGWVHTARSEFPNTTFHLYDCGIVPINEFERTWFASITRKRPEVSAHTSYVRYCYDAYDQIPDYVLFCHGHETSWHQRTPLPEIIRLLHRILENDARDYINVSDRVYPDWADPNSLMNEKVRDLWGDGLGAILGGQPPDSTLDINASQACVSKRRITARSRETWGQIAAFTEKIAPGSPGDFGLEGSFHVLMGEPWKRDLPFAAPRSDKTPPRNELEFLSLASDPSARDAAARIPPAATIVAFYHDLQCLSGFGDRLLDHWAAATIARLLQPAAVLEVRWEEGLPFPGFNGTYATELFSVNGCRFVTKPPWCAVALAKHFSDTVFNEPCIIALAPDKRQIVLRSGRNWGNTSADSLHADLESYGLDPGITLERVVETYRSIARSTEPDPRLVEKIPDDITNRVGVHARLMDKLVKDEHEFDMSAETWRSIERNVFAQIERCVDRGEPLFVCSDDQAYRTNLVERIRSMGGDVVVASPAPEHRDLPGFGALVDFFALSRCARIVQMTKYSSFSLAAALVGDVPLEKFCAGEGGVGHRLDIWRSVLRLAEPA